MWYFVHNSIPNDLQLSSRGSHLTLNGEGHKKFFIIYQKERKKKRKGGQRLHHYALEWQNLEDGKITQGIAQQMHCRPLIVKGQASTLPAWQYSCD
jgi:hypothetical protein